MKKLIYIILLALIVSILIGCKAKTVYVPVESVKTEKEYIDRWLKDSVYIHDSIFFAKLGDTIYLEKYKTIYKRVEVKDSIYIVDSVKVSVPYPVIETKEVNRLKNWQMILMCLGGALIAYVGLRIFRFFR